MIQCLIIMRLEKRIICKDVFLYNTYDKLYFLLVGFFYLINFSAKSQVHTWLFAFSWEQRKLSELGEIVTGSTPSTSKSEYYSDVIARLDCPRNCSLNCRDFSFFLL